MAKKPQTGLAVVPAELIVERIYLIRGQKVMLDRDLAELYGVPTARLNEQVKRNRNRFPDEFMFQLTRQEAAAVRSKSQNAILKRGQNIKYLPYAFTEHGVAMLSAVLRSDRAVKMSILIVKAFVRLREILATHKDLARALEDLRHRQDEQGEQISAIIETINNLLGPGDVPPKRQIGFVTDEDAGEGENP
jgi:phage regulator Rha-like protein